jgi:hypothetical protein
MANGHGGKRPNSGPAKGAKYAPTLKKEEARDLVRQRVLKDLEPMLRAQVRHAIGIQHLMLRQKDGTFKRSDNIDEIEAALNSGDPNSYYIFTKDPSVQAFTDLMNRALDKPKEQEQDVQVTGKLVIEIAKGW